MLHVSLTRQSTLDHSSCQSPRLRKYRPGRTCLYHRPRPANHKHQANTTHLDRGPRTVRLGRGLKQACLSRGVRPTHLCRGPRPISLDCWPKTTSLGDQPNPSQLDPCHFGRRPRSNRLGC